MFKPKLQTQSPPSTTSPMLHFPQLLPEPQPLKSRSACAFLPGAPQPPARPQRECHCRGGLPASRGSVTLLLQPPAPPPQTRTNNTGLPVRTCLPHSFCALRPTAMSVMSMSISPEMDTASVHVGVLSKNLLVLKQKHNYCIKTIHIISSFEFVLKPD